MDRDQILRLLGEREAVARVEWLRLEQEAGRIAGLIEECRRSRCLLKAVSQLAGHVREYTDK